MYYSSCIQTCTCVYTYQMKLIIFCQLWVKTGTVRVMNNLIPLYCLTSNPDSEKGRLTLYAYKSPFNIIGKEADVNSVIEKCPNTRNVQPFDCIHIASWKVRRCICNPANSPVWLVNGSCVLARKCDRISNIHSDIAWSLCDLNS